jgi:hypothetical protein
VNEESPTKSGGSVNDLVTLDRRTENVIILAREEINIKIEPNGRWRFV